MKKRIVSLLLALVMAVSLLPVSAFAAEVDVPAVQDVPAVEQQNDENTTPDTPAEEPQQQDAESAGGEDQSEEPAAEPMVYVTSNISDNTVEVVNVVNSPLSVKGGETIAFSYDPNGNNLAIKPVASVKVGDTTCNITAVSINGVRREKKSTLQRFGAGTVEGFSGQINIGKELKTVAFLKNYELTGNVQVKFFYDNVTETPMFTPVVASNNAAHGSVTTAFDANDFNFSSWTVTATPKDDWYKLDYVADEAGNKFVSKDGKTAEITVTAADQKFTAYFTATVAPMYDETPADSVTVNVTISNDGIPLMGADGTVLANLDVTVPYFDLADYGLSNFYRYGTEFGWGSYNDDELIERPTALHAYIYLIERFYMGLPADQCGKGMSNPLTYSKATTALYMDGAEAYKSGVRKALTVTGSPTSLYMSNFWGHDENLMYFVNHKYPLMGKGWGSTCDYILLSDGDRLDVGLFTNWDFYKYGGFNQFSQDAYNIAQGDTVTTSAFKAGTSAAENGESPALEAIKDLKVAVYDADWNRVADLTGEGTYSYTFDKAGTYYIMGVDANAKTSNACYAPAIAKVTVVGSTEPGKDTDGNYLIGNTAELIWLQNYVAKNPNTAINAALTANVSLAGVGSFWSGINGFTGTFDGRGHTITMDGAPLFTTLGNEYSKATTVVTDLTIAGKVQNDKGDYTGGLANFVTGETSIRNVVMKANVTGATAHVGGLVGALRLSGPAISIENCKNYGDVYVTARNNYSTINVGGIVGSTFSNGCTVAITIQGCENYGTVTGDFATKYGPANVGGIAGAPDDNAIITDCLNAGNVSAISSVKVNGYYLCAGGIAGKTSYQTQRIERCYNAGTITGSTVGGIVGTNSGATVDSCYNRGAVIVKGDVEYRYGGGIMGQQSSSHIYNSNAIYSDPVTNCYNVGTVSCDKMTDKTYLGAATGTFFRDFNDKPASGFSVTIGEFEVYALEGTCDKITGNAGAYSAVVSANKMAFKTSAELKADAMLTTLGDAFKKDAGNINNGYPVLVWQVSEACTDHTPGAAVRENEVPATCTKDGSHDEVIYCTVCKAEISRKTVTDKATGHKAQAAVKENVKDATCTAAGSHDDVVYCSVCQAEISRKTVTDKALGHDWDSATGKCKRCETACDHKWTNGKCDTCGYTCQHVGGDAVKEKEVPATCTKDGSHDEVVYCTICKAEVSRKTVTDKALGHTWDNGVVTTLPTTSKEGVKTFTCTVCKATKTETIAKLGEDKKDESAANEAINLINGIGKVDKSSKSKIEAARKAYDGLTEDQKKLVPASVLKTLTDAEAAYAKLTKPGTKPGKPSTSTDTKKDDGKTVKSGQTGDAGVTLYAAMGLVAVLAGAVIITRKRKEN